MDRTSIPDDDLVALARDGDDASFGEIVRRYKDRVATVLFGILRDRDAALDLTQEAFFRLHRCLGRYRPEGKLRTFLFTIAANAARDALKARRREGVLYLSEYRERLEALGRPRGAEPEAPHADLDREDVRRMVRAALGRFPDFYREALLLRDGEGLPYKDVARIAACSVGTAKSRVSRARSAFRDAFGRLARRAESGGA